MTFRDTPAVNEFYHIYNRGTDRREIFSSTADYERFMALLYLSNSKSSVHISNYQGSTLIELLSIPRENTLVDVCAYCLMPNHFHVLIREKEEGNISKFMQKITTGYTMYFNTRYERTGSLMQGRYKSLHVADDRYMKHVLSYLHLNPVKLIEPKWRDIGINDRIAVDSYLKEYRYSSFLDYSAEDRSETVIINRELMLEYVDGPISLKSSIQDWLEAPNPIIKVRP